MRPVARKVRIEELVTGEYKRSEDGTEPAHLVTPWGVQLTRARVMGTVVDKFIREDGSYRTFTLDDGSGIIRVKVWGKDVDKISDTNVGDLVDVIGRVREFEGEVYLAPETIIKVRDPNWETVRVLEIVRERRKMLACGARPSVEPEPEPTQVVIEKQTSPETAPQQGGGVDESLKEKVLEVVKQFPSGVTISEIYDRVDLAPREVDEALRELLADGRIYEPESGRYRVV